MKVLLVRLSNRRLYAMVRPTPRRDEPLGIEYLAAGLIDSHDVVLLDLDVTDFSDDQLKKYLTSLSPELIGITIPTPLVLEAKNFIKIAKKAIPGTKISIGGPHPSALPIESLKDMDADISAFGEGEETIKELADGLPHEKINGIAYRVNDIIKINPARQPIQNLDNMLFPERTKLPRKNYLQYSFDPSESKMNIAASIMTSRSCPYRCIFCASKAIFGHRVRFRSPNNVVDEIEELVNTYNVRNFIFVDDCFTLNKKRTQLICEEIIKRKLDIEWKVDTRADTISEKLLSLMKKSGCRLIVYGVEAGSQRVLDLIRKQIKIDTVKEAFRLTKKVGICTHANFIIGHPTETEEEIWETIKFAKELDPAKVGFYLCLPLPGSELYEMAKSRNLITNDFSEFRWYGQSVSSLSAVPGGRLEELQNIAYEENPKYPK